MQFSLPHTNDSLVSACAIINECGSRSLRFACRWLLAQTSGQSDPTCKEPYSLFQRLKKPVIVEKV